MESKDGQGTGTRAGPRISLLGGFGLSDGHVDVAIAEGPQRLIAFLALRKKPVRRTLAAGALWPGSSPDHAHSSLRSTLARLDDAARSALEVTASKLGIADRITVDLWESEALARRLIGPHESLKVHHSAAADVSALSSDVLPDRYEDWVIVEAEAWRQRRLHALEALTDDLRAEGAFGDAVAAAQAAIKADGLRESPRAALIRVHLAEGNVSEALREFSRYRELLLRELGLEPTPRLRDLLDGSG
ncbi:BTAD domain-containing putative transcriptional regulator [Nocardiopsis sp. N85]|uniref:AfsR/SARP family transcriptional regulator n=1 Tax=Nocardiopsis sp. N85 TaxID=3029400 RepID=UPI00237F7A65|nr:BTAD domain-containing putative transcriptional regulator [Nocardiopsis sp. N85]MDE3725287.1 BTAD domain-containing putative transcriptional regulator [Nocardiopsis sp. N85]